MPKTVAEMNGEDDTDEGTKRRSGKENGTNNLNETVSDAKTMERKDNETVQKQSEELLSTPYHSFQGSTPS